MQTFVLLIYERVVSVVVVVACGVVIVNDTGLGAAEWRKSVAVDVVGPDELKALHEILAAGFGLLAELTARTQSGRVVADAGRHVERAEEEFEDGRAVDANEWKVNVGLGGRLLLALLFEEIGKSCFVVSNVLAQGHHVCVECFAFVATCVRCELGELILMMLLDANGVRVVNKLTANGLNYYYFY